MTHSAYSIFLLLFFVKKHAHRGRTIILKLAISRSPKKTDEKAYCNQQTHANKKKYDVHKYVFD